MQEALFWVNLDPPCKPEGELLMRTAQEKGLNLLRHGHALHGSTHCRLHDHGLHRHRGTASGVAVDGPLAALVAAAAGKGDRKDGIRRMAHAYCNRHSCSVRSRGLLSGGINSAIFFTPLEPHVLTRPCSMG